MTAPHQGNYGVNPEDGESGRVQVGRLRRARGVRARLVVAGAGNARRVPRRGRRGRDRGHRHAGADASAARRAGRCARPSPPSTSTPSRSPGASGRSPAWRARTWRPRCRPAAVRGRGRGRAGAAAVDGPALRVAAYDFGIKRNILRLLAASGCETTVFPATTPGSGGPGRRVRRRCSCRTARATPRRRGTGSRRSAGALGRIPRLRHLPRPPAARAGARRADVQAAVRPPRREPAGQGPRHGPRRDHQPQPRVRRRSRVVGRGGRRGRAARRSSTPEFGSGPRSRTGT